MAKQVASGKGRTSLLNVVKAGTRDRRGKFAHVKNVEIKPIGRKAGKVILSRTQDVKLIDGAVRYMIFDSAADKQMGKIRRTYKSAGYTVATTTSDGVVIVEPRSKPDSFALKRLKKAVHKAAISEGFL